MGIGCIREPAGGARGIGDGRGVGACMGLGGVGASGGWQGV